MVTCRPVDEHSSRDLCRRSVCCELFQFALLFEHVTKVVRNDTKKVGTSDVFAIGGKNFPITSLGLCKLAA